MTRTSSTRYPRWIGRPDPFFREPKASNNEYLGPAIIVNPYIETPRVLIVGTRTLRAHTVDDVNPA